MLHRRIVFVVSAPVGGKGGRMLFPGGRQRGEILPGKRRDPCYGQYEQIYELEGKPHRFYWWFGAG
jgi:hypothetical protein